MIFFLVNNNYHLDLDFKLAKQISSYELGLIQVPYSLIVVDKHPLFNKVLCFNYKLHISLKRFLFHPFELIKIQNLIDAEIKIDRKDILLVHTEIDLLNQYIIQKFYDKQAKIFLLEDGTATMCTFNLVPVKAHFIETIKTIILRKIYNYKYTSIAKYGPQILPVMNDKIFNGVIVNFGNSILRNIPLIKLKQIKEPFEILYRNGAIFFSQPLYYWYMGEDQYLDYLNNLLPLYKNFSHFFFKFHPSDNEKVKLSVTNLIHEKYSGIIIVQENDIAENLIQKYPVQYAITFNSTAALNLINKGVVPVFLNWILNSEFPDLSFSAFDQFLKSISCVEPNSFSEVKPGFCAFPDTDNDSATCSISDILK